MLIIQPHPTFVYLVITQCGSGKTETAKQLMNFLTTICAAYTDNAAAYGEEDALVGQAQPYAHV